MIEVIEYYNQEITNWISAYYANGVFLLLAIVAFIYLYVSCREIRYKFLLPVFLMLFVTVNPILYMYIYRRIVYWRLLWMLPSTMLISISIVVFLKRVDKIWMKWAMVFIISIFLITQGQYVFTNGIFLPRSNWEKLSQETIDVCDIMLEIDETPKVVVPAKIFTEVRQYAPEVSMMYGRNAHWYITWISEEASNVYNVIEWEFPDYEYVLSICTNSKYNFVVVLETKPIDNDILEKYCYQEVGRTGGMIIYYNPELEE